MQKNMDNIPNIKFKLSNHQLTQKLSLDHDQFANMTINESTTVNSSFPANHHLSYGTTTHHLPPQQKHNMIDPKYGRKFNSCGRNHQTDLDSIELYSEHDNYNITGGRKKIGNSSQSNKVKWSRNNIAVTMERFEPISYASNEKWMSLPSSQHNSSSSSSHQDYSYAYYEPGPHMQHKKVPATTPDKLPHDNFYEEIHKNESWKPPPPGTEAQYNSMTRNMFKEEFKQVQHLHRRVLGELDLSVEAMLMPTANDKVTEAKCPRTDNTFSEIISLDTSSDELLSPTLEHPPNCSGGDVDSGFSGSCSGASYIGSLRYFRRGSECETNLSMNDNCSKYSHRSSAHHPGDTNAIAISTDNLYKYNSGLYYDTLGLPLKHDQKMGGKNRFWKKGWLKFPLIPSTATSVSSRDSQDKKSDISKRNIPRQSNDALLSFYE